MFHHPGDWHAGYGGDRSQDITTIVTPKNLGPKFYATSTKPTFHQKKNQRHQGDGVFVSQAQKNIYKFPSCKGENVFEKAYK